MPDETIKPELKTRADLFKNDLKGNTDLITVFDKVVEKHEGNWKAVFEDLRADPNFDERTIKNLEFTNDIAEWTRDNKTLVSHLQEDANINTLRAIARNFNREEFGKLVKEDVVPEEKDRTEYTNDLFKNLFSKEPSAMIVNMIQDPKVPLLNDEPGKFIGSLLSKNPRFNIKTDSVNILLKNQENFAGLDPAQIERVAAELKTLQRITSISPIPEAIPALINKKFISAHQITELPPDQFFAQMGDDDLPTEDLHDIYTNSENKKIIYEHALMQIKEAGQGTGVAIIDNGYMSGGVVPVGTGGGIATVGGGNISGAAAGTLEDNNLSWELLFGEGSYCECGECTSVYSPAAYFVDLLQYLRNNNIDRSRVRTTPTDISNTPLEKFFKRRPDLGDLELSCENTNTELPYVDLVNEVLEQYVSYGRTNVFNVTDETKSELLAAPQHTEKTAYQKLKEAVYPFTLPYDQPRDQIRVYSKFLGTSRHELMSVFKPARNNTNVLEPAMIGGVISKTLPVTFNTTDYERSELDRLHAEFLRRAADAEYLGMSPEEYAIITGESFVSREYWDTQRFVGGSRGIHTDAEYRAKIGLPETANSYFGYTTVDEMLSKDEARKDGLPFVSKQFLPRTGLTINELIELLKTRFINPPRTGAIFVVGGEITLTNTCLVEDMRLSLGVRDFGNSQCDKMHRFIRLWRKAGWAMSELDECIASLGNGMINARLLGQIASIKKLADATGLEISKLLTFWGNIGTYGKGSLYQRLFLTHDLKPYAFKLDNPNDHLSNHKSVIMAALNLSADDLEAIVSYAQLDDTLTLANISALYRYRLLSKVLGIRIQPLLNVLPLFGDVFTNADVTLAFFEKWQRIQDSDFTPKQLNYIIRGVDSGSPLLAPSQNEVTQLTNRLSEKQTEIEEAHKDITDISEVNPEFVKGKLASWFSQDVVDRIIGLFEGTSVYRATAAQNLTITIPTGSSLSKRLIYNKQSGDLEITGILTPAQIAAAIALSADASWSGAVNQAAAQADDIFADFPPELFTNGAAARTALLAPSDEADVASKKRFYFINAFLPFLRIALFRQFIFETFAEAASLSLEMTKTMLSDVITIPDTNGTRTALTGLEALGQTAKPDPVLPTLTACKKIAILVNNFELSKDDVNFLRGHAADFGGIDFNSLTFAHWQRLEAYVRLRKSIPQDAKISLIGFWEWAAANPTASATELVKKLATLFDAPEKNIEALILPRHFNLNASKLKNEENLLRLKGALDMAEKTGLPVNVMFMCAYPLPTFKQSRKKTFYRVRRIARRLIDAIRSKYNRSDWERVVKPLNDGLRNRSRDALISYILQQPDLKAAGVHDADGLFEYFLIDVQMDACMKTSRIKQAISSVQLFIQRCMLGLEEKNGISPGVLDRGRWEWMQRYRVWEANRKVFLYPENWIESNLRDDKSPFFREMESELLQKDINKENIEDALKSYLYKVDEVSNMQVIGLYVEGVRTNNAWSTGAKLHVFSRTRNAPYFFYYRYFDLTAMNWYPWERIQVDIPSYDLEDQDGKIIGNGCYLTPVVWNRKLLIFFPQFMKKTKTIGESQNASITVLADLPASAQKPTEYWEIKLAFSEYRYNKWQPKQMSSSVILDIPNEFVLGLKIGNFVTLKTRLNELSAQIEKIQKEIEKIYLDIQINNDPILIANFTVQIAQKFGQMAPLKTEFDSKNVGLQAQSRDIAATQRIPIAPISSFMLFPVMYDNDRKLAVKIFRSNRQSPVGAFEFDGSGLQRNVSSPINVNGSPASNFHYVNSEIFSRQISTLNPYDQSSFFFTTPPATANNQVPFNYQSSLELINRMNSGEIGNVFGYNLLSADKANEFGLPVGSTAKDYNELKRPYSIYNWELFFHSPAMLADAQSKAQRFEDAMNWFHYVFNPLANGTDTKRFWQFVPFKEVDSKDILERIFSGLQPNTWDQTISEWRDNPFKPHLVARSRPVAYMKWVVMKYIDNILDWGDYLFRQDTIESINQATQLYVLGLHILGRRPQVVSGRGKTKTQTYNSLLAKWDAFSNAKSEFEVAVPFAGHIGGRIGVPVTHAFDSLYFCIPNNPQLLAYWDKLADRLFKIRHCQNIEGIVRELPLFEPPIDPALLVQAAAQGVSLGSVLNDLNTPMPNYRFYYLLQKALELCNELKSLGSAMLSAIEKKDSETISLLRAKHESSMNNLVMELKKQQLDEANKALEGLQQNRKSPEHRMNYYLQLIGEDVNKMPAADSDFTELANSIEKPVDESGLKLIKYEKEDMDKASLSANLQFLAGTPEVLAGILYAIPLLAGDVKPFGMGAGASFGGTNLGQLTQTVSKVLQISSAHLSHQSMSAGKKGGFLRSLQDRIMQANSAGHEIKQIDKQIVSQKIRIQMANQEITNQQKQIDNAIEVEEFLKSKYTDEELYTWMRGNLKTLYRQVYNLAYDLAKKAEKTFAFERGVSNPAFIKGGYFDAGRDGLLAGEQLYVGLKQLEAAYHETRGYDYEITRHISLAQLNPLALVVLRQTGKCEFEVPEVLFDLDFPGHYFRRIKSVSLSIPCIAGPYVGVNATLGLVANKLRTSAIAAGGYAEKVGESDDRFTGYNVPIRSIAASSSQNDSGVFELNFKDERYLPFEGAGVISRWSLELSEIRQFDWDTISDVVIHMKYTAKEGGYGLRIAAADSLRSQLAAVEQELDKTGLHVAINLKHDLPNEWNMLKGPVGEVDLKVDKSRAPFYAQSLIKNISEVIFIVKSKTGTPSLEVENTPVSLTENTDLKLYIGRSQSISLSAAFKLKSASATNLDELVMVVKFGL